MVQTIQIKRKFTGAGVPAALAPGELAYNNTGDKLYVGGDLNTVKGLVGSERQLEIHALSPAQEILGGTKTIAVTNLKIPGGNVGEFLSISAADGALVYAPMVSASQKFVGSANGTTGEVLLTFDAGGGFTLPAPAPANDGWYVIYDVAGAVPPPAAGAGVTGPFNIGDWLISNGTAWTHLQYGGISSVTAADVGVVAPITGGANVQAVLETMQTTDTTLAASIAANTAAIALLPTTAYVDAENTAQETAQAATDGAQDTAIAANTAAIANKITKPAVVAAIGNIATFADLGGAAALDGGVTIAQLQASITSKGDVVGPAGAVADNIAVYDLATGKLIKDGGTSVTAINTAIAAKADTAALASYLPLAGGTVTGPIILPAAAPTTDPEAANKKYVDDQINSIPGATPPEVTGPELTGDGTTLTPITFTGISTTPAGEFGGNGLSATPLALLLVDGGTYV